MSELRESDAERALMTLLKWGGLPEPEREYRFVPGRKFRADFAYPADRLLIEVDGGAFIAGRHTRGTGFEKDAEKASLAAVNGWRVIRVTPRHIDSGQALEWIRAALAKAAA